MQQETIPSSSMVAVATVVNICYLPNHPMRFRPSSGLDPYVPCVTMTTSTGKQTQNNNQNNKQALNNTSQLDLNYFYMQFQRTYFGLLSLKVPYSN